MELSPPIATKEMKEVDSEGGLAEEEYDFLAEEEHDFLFENNYDASAFPRAEWGTA